MSPEPWTPQEGVDVVITMRGTVRRVAAHGHVALVQLEDGSTRWVEIPRGTLPSRALEWAPAAAS